MDTKEYAKLRYDTVEVEEGLSLRAKHKQFETYYSCNA